MLSRERKPRLGGVSQFDGMSRFESDGMPYLVEADLARLRMSSVPMSVIARAQEKYVRQVYEACPRWRRWKKRKLALALEKATLVREMVEYR